MIVFLVSNDAPLDAGKRAVTLAIQRHLGASPSGTKPLPKPAFAICTVAANDSTAVSWPRRRCG